MFYILNSMKNKSIKQISERVDGDYKIVYSFVLKVIDVSNKDNILKNYTIYDSI